MLTSSYHHLGMFSKVGVIWEKDFQKLKAGTEAKM